jgi:hypothetical protein
MDTAWTIVLVIITIKSFTIGSSFSFYKWFKYGKKYLKEYDEWLMKTP